MMQRVNYLQVGATGSVPADKLEIPGLWFRFRYNDPRGYAVTLSGTLPIVWGGTVGFGMFDASEFVWNFNEYAEVHGAQPSVTD